MISEAKRTTLLRRMIFLDTETWSGRGKTLDHLRLGWLCYWESGEEKWHYFTTKEQAWGIIEHYCARRAGPIHIYAYNSKFDYQVLGLMEMMKRPGWTYDRTPIMSEKLFIFSTLYKKHTSVHWLDMGNHVGGKIPLADIGDKMALDKEDLPADKDKGMDIYSEEELSPYCKRDVEIVKRYMLEWFRFITDNDLGEYKPTLAGQCLTAYRHRFIDNPIFVHTKREVIDLERESYRGGRMEAFWLGKKDDVYKLDVNSYHPYVMRNFRLPFKLTNYYPPQSCKSTGLLDRILSRNNMFIAKCHVVVDDRSRMIAVRRIINHEEKNIYPVGDFIATLTSQDYIYLRRYGGKVLSVKEVAEYEAGVLFKSYIDFFYEKRLAFKAEGNKTMDQMAKYMMNSLEGKMAQKIRELIPFTDHAEQDHDYWYSDGKTRVYVYVYNGKGYIRSDRAIEGYNTFVPIASFIRSYTRCITWEDIISIRKAGGEVYYTDTDSLLCDDAAFEAMMNRGRVDPDKLGSYKMEGRGKYVGIGAKEYYFGEELKTKGIKKNAEEISPRVFKQKKFNTMRSMLKRGITCGVEITDVVIDKSKSRYHQGIPPASGEGWVKPYRMVDNEILNQTDALN